MNLTTKEKEVKETEPAIQRETRSSLEQFEANRSKLILESRAGRRETKEAEVYMDTLMSRFIARKNELVTDVDGFLVLKHEEYIRLVEALNAGWKRFATNSKNPGNKVNFPAGAFKKNVEEHMNAHRQLAWQNHCLRLCNNRYNIYPDIKEIAAVFSLDITCDDGAVMLLKKRLFINRVIEVCNDKFATTPLIKDVQAAMNTYVTIDLSNNNQIENVAYELREKFSGLTFKSFAMAVIYDFKVYFKNAFLRHPKTE